MTVMTDAEIVQILRTYPPVISKDVFRKLCRISPYHARYLLESQIIPSIIKPKSTHKYEIPLTAVLKYLEDREINPERYLIPVEYRKKCSKKKLKRPTARQLAGMTDASLMGMYRVEALEYPDLMTVAQISEFTGYSAKTVFRWCHRGLVRTLWSRNRMLVPKYSLLEFMISQEFRQISRKSERHWEMLSRITE